MRFKYSIIIPVKNEGQDIINCIESFLTANYLHHNCEIILVDDSDYKEQEKLKLYLKKNKLKDISHFGDLELGVSGSRNHGAKVAKGEYLIFINADNIAPNNFFNLLNKDLENENVDCLSLNNFITNNNNKYAQYLNLFFKKKFFENEYFLRFKEKSFISWTEGFTVKKEKFIESGGFPHLETNKFKAGEDLILGFNLIESKAKGSLSSSAYIKHKVPDNLKDFFHHRFIRGYGVPQISRYYLRNNLKTLSIKTFLRFFLRFFEIILIFPLFFQLINLQKYSKHNLFLLKFFPIIFIDKYSLMFAEIKSYLKILRLSLSSKQIEPLKYFKSNYIKNLYVTASPENKYSPLKKTLEHIYGDSIKTITLSKNFINYSQSIRVPIEIFIYKVFFRFGIRYDYTNCSARIVNQVLKGNIEQIILNKGNFINSSTLKFVKEYSPKTKIIYWCEDNMFIRQHKTRNFANSFQFFDYYYSVDRGKNENSKIKEVKMKKLLDLPTLYHGEIEKGKQFVNSMSSNLIDNKNERSITFIGYFDQERVEYLKYLSENNIKVDVYGNGWKKVKKSNLKNITFNNPIYGEDYFNKIRNSFINLNFIRKLSKDIINNKTVEVIGSGGFLISEYSDFQNLYFPHEKSAIYFRTKEELLEKIIYVKENPKKILEIKKYNIKKMEELNLSTLNMYNKLLDIK